MGNLSGMGRNIVLLCMDQWDEVAVLWPAAVSFWGGFGNPAQCVPAQPNPVSH